MENEAEDNYTHLVSYFVNSKSSKTSISDKAREYFESVQQYMERSESFRLHLCGRMIQVMIHSSKNDYAATARVCEEAIAFFKGKTFESNLPLQAFYYQLIVCYIQLKEFEKGEVIIQQYQTVFEEGSFNWYKLQELFFLLAGYFTPPALAAKGLRRFIRDESGQRVLNRIFGTLFVAVGGLLAVIE